MELILILSVVAAGYAYDKASFYGASYISYPLQEAKGVTDMSFRFRTHLADALLLLAAGKTDYCMIRLEGGRLKLHINLGAGESELSSPKGIHLNDSQWHHVSIIRREANLTMKVDETAVKKRLPGRFFELNIHFGIFLGGQGDFSELFLGHMENFRGCMEDVYYNGVKIIEKARSRSGSVHVEGVTWNCAPEFDADLNSDISFVDEGAYLILPRINSRAGGKWQIEFKTIAQNAIILYNAGGGRGSDFLAVEILEGVIRVKMARGQIVHTVRVNDGQWHKMHLSFYPSMIELTVDNIAMHTRIESGGTRYLDLSDSFYLGGIDSEKQQRAFTKGIKAADSSIMGCIKPIEVDEKIYGLPNAVVTYGVSPKCVWWYPCHSSPGNPPCVPQGVCEQHGVDHFTCKCDSDLCINPDYAEKYKSPQHGRIAIDLSLQRNSQQYNFIEGEPKSKQFFTLLDLSRDKVRYVHDGSENHQDAIVLDMELIPETKFTLPSYLQGRNTFVLHVNVTPVNDPPVLNLLPGKVLRLTQAEDPDTAPEDLLYTVLHGKNEANSGHIEMSGQPVDSFTQQDIDAGVISYVHGTTNDKQLNKTSLRLTLQFKASVGSIRTNTLYDFRLTFIKLELYQSVNEELVLNNTREAFISSQHLTFKTNPLALPSDRVVYTILRPPKYGILHLSSGKHHLQMHSTFTQQHIDTDQLWYRLHRRAYSHIQDEFTFVVGATECKNITGVMTIRHTPGTPSSDRTEGRVHTTLERLQVTEGSRMVIPATHLNFRTDAVTNLIFNITHLPKHGKIEVINDILKVSRDNTTYFTLEELNSDRVYYAHDDSESRHDSFHFMALSPEPEDFQYVGVFHIDIILKNDNSPVRANDNVFHIVHGGARLITARDLSYTDADLDTKPSDIIYTVQRYIKDPPNGGIFRADNPSEQIAQFSQDDINKNLVLFKHQGKEYGKMAFWISDGLFDVNGNLEIQASPPFIRMYPSNGSIVENGKAVVITSRDMQVDTNMNCLEEDIRYEITLEPKHGTIEVGEGQGAFTFTQLDVTASRVAYRHREPKTPTDQFRFKVICLDTWGEGVYVIKIFPSSYWEPLRVTTNLPLVVEESTSVNITKDILEVMHPQIEPSNIVYQVTEGPYHGWLEITTTPGTLELENYNEEPVHIKVFDQSIINANRLVYVQSGVNRTRDRIRMDVTNGIVWLRDVELNVVIIPEHFYVHAYNLTVVEGEAVSVKPDLFRTITDYYKGKVVAYKVVEKPKYGKIVMADQELNLLPVLKLNSGNIQKNHRTHSNVNDIDTPPENVTVRVVDIVSGYIAMQGNLDTAVHHFTQADIDKGKVVFVHKNGTKGKMIFNVTDGLHELSKITFLITTKSVSLKLTRKHNMKVFPLMREPLNNYMLMSKCSDPTRTIIYKIERAPTLGRLIMLNGESHHRSIKQFTQQDINNTVVFYEHTHPFSDLYTNDSFIFTIEAPLAKPLTDQIFNIDISVSSGGLAKYVNIPPIKVQEGDKVPIKVNVSNVITYLETQAGLRQPQIEAQWSQPSHGELKPFMSSLTQSQIESGVVNYEHDDSDTTQDKIDMALFLLPDYVLLCNVSIIIHITPVNDQPFRLLTDTPQIQVVQGENYTITKNDLLTEDADTGPAGILYDIISGPTQGRMVMLDKNQTIDDAHSINKFTQDDINNGRVVYEHSGILQTATFYFRVWDGQFKPTYTVFTIDVIPVILNATSLHPIYLQQGSNVAAVTTDQIYVDTNAKTSKVLYNITRQPLHGMVYVGRNPVSYFTHRDLMEKVVIYMQNDMTTANDSFDLIAYVHNSNATRPFTIEVIVQPLMTLGDLRVEVEKARITLRTMDASGLAKLTASDPVYTLLRKPRFGTLKKIIRSSGEKTSAREREVAYFTHEDVKAGVIYFVTKKKVNELNGFEDSFRFLLAATIFQPAVGDVKIIIGNRQKKNMPGPNDPESHEGVPVANGETASYYMMILMALSGTVLAIVVIFGLLKCRRYLMRDQNALVKIHGQSQGAVAPIPLPRPPEHLMPSPSQGTPPIKRYVSSEQSVHTGASTPLPSAGSVACKFGSLQAEDWSSYEASESAYPVRATGVAPANPMLRRNQYWV
ncbi:hypothetical protein HF086_008672 [Spodoptera exigua]|uniref:Laminin G domain-containing protein n=1 Tax=Spodoptera exigua TaxID=7107 RepID=A0A922MWD2_SPOEX|nr:hypothetical protein HF086_008672 [Spodoptera exigua]